jgi:TRAP-type C4-dicarboxylate transport system permease small subunit
VKLLAKAGIVFDYVLTLLSWIACALISFVTVIIGADVFSRQVLGHPTVWVTELCEYSLLWITFLGTAWLLREEGHIRIDLILKKVNPRSANLLDVFTSIMGAAVSLILAWYGTEVVVDHFMRGVPSIEMLGIPKYLILMVIPIGCFLLFVQFLRRTRRYLVESRVLGETKKQEK